MIRRTSLALAAFCLSFVAAARVCATQLYCSSPNTAWCQGMANGFEKATGTKVAVVQKATAKCCAQVKAERANPKGRHLVAGPADAYLQAAEDGLLETYTSPNVKDLQDWAQRITAVSQGRVSGVYGGILSLGYNTELQTKKKLPVPECWKDLLDPVYKNEVMLGNPVSSGNAYLMLGVAGADLRRGGRVQVHEGAQCQRELVRAFRHRSDDRREAGEIYVGSTLLTA
jgi:iron(III) transport system substrate-binding protein